MSLNAEQLELPYFIPTDENVRQILSELRTDKQKKKKPVRDKDYLLFRERGSRKPWRWEGTGNHPGKRSTRTFKTEASAIADAERQLADD